MLDHFQFNAHSEIYSRRFASIYRSLRTIYDPSDALAQEPDIEEKVLRNARLAHALNFRWAQVAGRKWSVAPAEEGEPEEAVLAKIVLQGMGKIRRFTNARKMLARADFSGARFAEVRKEVIWAPFGDGKMRRWVVPVMLKDIPKERFRWQRTDGTKTAVHLEVFDLQNDAWTKVPKSAPLIRHVYDDSEETLGYGRGLREALYFCWYAISHIHRERIDAVERFGQGRLVLKLAGEKDASIGSSNATIRDRALATLAKMKGRHEFVIGQGDELVQLDGSMTGHEMMSALTKEIEDSAVQLILGSILPTGGGADVGSNARAQVEQESTDVLIQTCGDMLEESVSDGIAVPFLTDNYANLREMGLDGVPAPKFTILRGGHGDPLQNAQRIQIAMATGLKVKRSEAYDLVELTEPGEDDDVLEPPQQPGMPPGGGMPGAPGDDQGAGGDPNDPQAGGDEQQQGDPEGGGDSQPVPGADDEIPEPDAISLAEWDEAKHKRGQPQNAGQFGPGGGGAKSAKPKGPGRQESSPKSSVDHKGVAHLATGKTGTYKGENTAEYESASGSRVWATHSGRVVEDDSGPVISAEPGARPGLRVKNMGSDPMASGFLSNPEWRKEAKEQQLDGEAVLKSQGRPPPKDGWELRVLPLSSVTPSQSGEDYDNASSQALSEHIGTYGSSGRRQDYRPIAVDENLKILDGNHRHAARKMAGITHILAVVPKGAGQKMGGSTAPQPKPDALSEWREEDHPRGQPGNAGEFGPGGGKSTKGKAPPTSSSTEDIPQHLADAVALYSAGANENDDDLYREINDAAKDKHTDHVIVRDLDAAIEASPLLPKGMKLWRGIALVQGKDYGDLLGNLKKGNTLTPRAFASTSTERGIAESFARGDYEQGAETSGGVLLEIELGQATRAAKAHETGQAEYILPRGSKYGGGFKVDGVARKDGLYHVCCRYLCHSDAVTSRDDALAEWDESKHPRGQPGNAGEFGPGGSSATGVAESPRAKPKKAPPGSQLDPKHLERLKAVGDGRLPQEGASNIRLLLDRPDPDAGPLAVWTDPNGRTQYAYSAKFHEQNAAKKWKAVEGLEPLFEQIHSRAMKAVQAGEHGTAEHRAATAAALIIDTGMRPGSAHSADREHYGATTLQGRHVKVEGGKAVFDFVGKEGVHNHWETSEPVLVDAIGRYKAAAGDQGSLFGTSDDAVRAATPGGARLKDFRTIHGTRAARKALASFQGPPPPLTGDPKKDARAIKKALLAASRSVATALNNTPAIARGSYIHPAVFNEWLDRVGAGHLREAAGVTAMTEWEESKHPRADDGKFGHGSGDASAEPRRTPSAEPAEPKPAGRDTSHDRHDPNATVLDEATRNRVKPIPKQCWWNALKAAKVLAKKKGADSVRYVEGYAVMSVMPIPYEHGWVEVDGKPVEATHDTPAAAYFPGVKYDPATTKAGRTMPLASQRTSKPMQDAMVAAHAHAFGMTPEKMRSFFAGAVERLKGSGTQEAKPDSLAEWDEGKHHRGQPGNAGQFGPGGGHAAPKAADARPQAPEPPTPQRPAQGQQQPKATAPKQAEPDLGYDPKAFTPGPELVKTHAQSMDAYFDPKTGAWNPERVKVHEHALANIFRGASPAKGQPVYHLMGGGPGSGKTSVVKRGHVHTPEGAVVINADDIKKDIPEMRQLIEAGNKRDSCAFVHEESSHVSKEAIKRAVAGGYSMTLDGTGNGTIDGLIGKMKDAKAHGYRVHADYVTVPTDEAIRRSDLRGERNPDRGHVPHGAIQYAHAAVSRIFPEAVARGLFDEARLWDTSGPEPRMIFESVGGKHTIHDEAAYKTFLAKGKEYSE